VGVSVWQRPERFGVAKARWALRADRTSVNYANYPTGSSGHTIYVFGVTVPIDSSRTVQAVVLPKVNGSVAGYQAALHIFALGL
jgi:hypothetical protein